MGEVRHRCRRAAEDEDERVEKSEGFEGRWGVYFQ